MELLTWITLEQAVEIAEQQSPGDGRGLPPDEGYHPGEVPVL